MKTYNANKKVQWDAEQEKLLVDLRARIAQLQALQASLEEQYPGTGASLAPKISMAIQRLTQLELAKIEAGYSTLGKE